MEEETQGEGEEGGGKSKTTCWGGGGQRSIQPGRRSIQVKVGGDSEGGRGAATGRGGKGGDGRKKLEREGGRRRMKRREGDSTVVGSLGAGA
eukprot:288334-Rhodomonas_salina.1